MEASHHVIVAADVTGSGAEQAMLLPMIEQAAAVADEEGTGMTTDAGYDSGAQGSCGPCALRSQCLRHPQRTPVRQVAMFAKGPAGGHTAAELMKQAIDSACGRAIYSQRIATVEPVFANIRHTKRLDRFTLRGKEKVGTQWRLYCPVHNVEKIARSGYRAPGP